MKKRAKEFIEAITSYNPLAIYIPGSPDPDAIASAYAIKMILKNYSIAADIFTEKKLSLPQNKAFVERLKIPIYFDKTVNLDKYEAYIVPDFQNNLVESIGDAIPCAAHIDHHSRSKSAIKCNFSLIEKNVGSTSTLIALMLKNYDLDFSEKERSKVATALTFGIQTDTDKYNHITDLDFEALSYLSEYVDNNILKDLNDMPLSPELLVYYNRAKGNETVYKDWGFFGIGYVDAKHRDMIAITADMILKKSEFSTIAVYALVENQRKGELNLDVSLRTKNNKVDLNRIIKRITPSGGGRQFKGAYQVKLNYFLSAPDRGMLWSVVEATTLETLRKSRDMLYITGLEKFYGNLKSKISSVLKRKTGEE